MRRTSEERQVTGCHATRTFALLCLVNLRLMLRDRILHAIFGASLAILLLVPLISGFSMRQVQELAISLAFSGVSFFLLIIALFFGSSSIWRDIENRYTTTVLTLPLSRTTYVLAKFTAISCFLCAIGLVLGVSALIVSYYAAASYPSEQPLLLGNLLMALGGDVCKSILVAAIAMLLSALSTSLYLPFFGTIALYLCGSASQEVFEYVTGEFGHTLHPLTGEMIRLVYYLLPNLSAFDYKVQAVYSLPIAWSQVFFSGIYAVIYTGLLVTLTIVGFNRRVI